MYQDGFSILIATVQRLAFHLALRHFMIPHSA